MSLLLEFVNLVILISVYCGIAGVVSFVTYYFFLCEEGVSEFEDERSQTNAIIIGSLWPISPLFVLGYLADVAFRRGFRFVKKQKFRKENL